jgi:outer membrane protein assembly factor BamB/predicted phosphohydrolase
MARRTATTVLLTILFIATAGHAQTAGGDFAFIQFSDSHISPHLDRTPAPGAPRGAASIAWICTQAVGPQEIAPLGLTTPPPAFAIATGDLTEYGVIDDTWAQFEQAFAALPYPLYVIPGNHDNTWVPMYALLRERHGGVNYAFDKFGCHFVCISSASPAEPVPTIDETTRRWLTRDLRAVGPDTPVFVALHHPPHSGEFAPAEYDAFIDLLRNYNVVLLLYGHGHRANHRDLDGIDGVMGGTTYGDHAGYNVISVQDDVLRVAYHKQGAAGGSEKAWQVLLEQPLTRRAPERLFADVRVTRVPDALDVELRLRESHRDAALADVEIRVDGEACRITPLADRPQATWRVDTADPADGVHVVTVRGRTVDGLADLATTRFCIEPDRVQSCWEFDAIKAAPVLVGDALLIATTGGELHAVRRDPQDPRELWTVATGGEILGTPARSDEAIVFGSGDGKVYAVDHAGATLWTYDAGRPVYGAPLIDDGAVYVGDNGGRLRCLDVADGRPRWVFARADYAIECKPCAWGDLIVFGAWDGYLYALNRDDGTLAWKTLGPKSSDGAAARYYAPADCGPVALGDTLFVCDRGYVLATYDREGRLGRRIDEGVAAIAAGPDGDCVYARCIDHCVCKIDATGAKLWERSVPAGRLPVPPTCTPGTVYVCSNTGLVSALDATDGRVRWSYQAIAQHYVMAPAVVDDSGICYVAGMNGRVRAIRPPRR